MTGNFHPDGDVDRLYLPRSEGGWRLTSIARMYESKIVSVVHNLELKKSHDTSLQFTAEQEQNDHIKEEIIGKLSNWIQRKYYSK